MKEISTWRMHRWARSCHRTLRWPSQSQSGETPGHSTSQGPTGNLVEGAEERSYIAADIALHIVVLGERGVGYIAAADIALHIVVLGEQGVGYSGLRVAGSSRSIVKLGEPGEAEFEAADTDIDCSGN